MSGQAFHWVRDEHAVWHGVIGETAVHLRHDGDVLAWATEPTDRWDTIATYFALDVELEPLYADWMDRWPRIEEMIAESPGLRVLRQDPEVALISFICSSCNNIQRIRTMVQHLGRLKAGRFGECGVFPAPSLSALKCIDERTLRDRGFGYRARYLALLHQELPSDTDAYLEGLRALDYASARTQLMKLPGVGAKVADCVCLFGLAKSEAVPVDTHIRRFVEAEIGLDDESSHPKGASYDRLASRLRGIMGPYAGWAQQYIFEYQRHTAQKRRRGER